MLAHENSVPFYVAAPTSTPDPALPSGDEIPIEERSPEEVTQLGERLTSPKGVAVRNPAFDVTPHRYVTAIITERGIVRPPYEVELKRLVEAASPDAPPVLAAGKVKGGAGA